MKTKQVIIIRKDLNMRKGKMIAQGAHASMKVFINLNCIHQYLDPHPERFQFELGTYMKHWIHGLYTKIVVSVNSKQELLDIYDKARDRHIHCSLVIDAGLTEFKEPTYTAVAVGPHDSDELDKITGDLPLL